LHRYAASRQRRLRPDGRGIRRRRKARPRRGRHVFVAGRRRGRGRSNLRTELSQRRMNDTGETITLPVHRAIKEIAPDAWDACAADVTPTVSHIFLNAMEESGSVSARAGWAPQHLSFSDPAGRIIGAVPMYLKSHSYGEYVFDWGWADAFERAGGRYYPKLQVSVPFTPATGRRLLVRPGTEGMTDTPGGEAALRGALAQGLQSRCLDNQISSVH